MDKKIILIVMSLLAVVLGVFVVLNMNSNEDNIMKYKDEIITFKQNDQLATTMTMEEVLSYDAQEIEVIRNTSKTEPTPYTYKGILLKTLLEEKDIELSGSKAVIASAVDGFVSVIPMDKVLEEDNVYLVYEWEGKPLGTREEDGEGPFMIIIKNDQFSQNWCKFTVEVKVE